MNKYLIIIFAYFSLLSFQITAQNNFKPMKDTVTFKKKVSDNGKKINTIESNFVQEKFLNVMSEKIISKGYFCFKKENNLRWEYTEPIKYVIVINKEKMFIKSNNKVNKFDIKSNKMFQSINDLMISSVHGEIISNKDFKNIYLENDKYYLVELTPLNKQTKDIFKKINIYVDKQDYSVIKIKLIELSDDYTSIDFINHKLNGILKDEKFSIN